MNRGIGILLIALGTAWTLAAGLTTAEFVFHQGARNEAYEAEREALSEAAEEAKTARAQQQKDDEARYKEQVEAKMAAVDQATEAVQAVTAEYADDLAELQATIDAGDKGVKRAEQKKARLEKRRERALRRPQRRLEQATAELKAAEKRRDDARTARRNAAQKAEEAEQRQLSVLMKQHAEQSPSWGDWAQTGGAGILGALLIVIGGLLRRTAPRLDLGARTATVPPSTPATSTLQDLESRPDMTEEASAAAPMPEVPSPS